MYDRLSIVIPVYNEGENILRTLAEIDAHVKTPREVLIVYDFEEDDTVAVVREIMGRRTDLRLVRNTFGRGALQAIKTGFLQAREEAVLVVMADLSDEMSRVDVMFNKMNEGYDVVCGSRYMAGGRQFGGGRLKKLLSRMAGLTLHFLVRVPTHDVTNSFKMYSRRLLREITIESTGGFEIGMEILLKAYFGGYRVTEIPSVWRDRAAGQSRFRLWKWLPKYLHWYWYALKCRLSGKPRARALSP
jgi:dolichol-phosphate mannosyltransferase